MDIQTARRRSRIIRNVRSFFTDRNVLEVETPVLSRAGAADCHIDVFSTEFHPAGFRRTDESQILFLQTSPEFAMKRLLTQGYGDIFQICKVFRNGELGKIHTPEFTMLEWYRAEFSMADLIDETAALLREILGNRPVVKKQYAELFREATGIDPLVTTVEAVKERCMARRKNPPRFATLTDALQFAMAELVEPALPADAITFVYNFPAGQAVFAALEPDDRRVARRFEAYAGGMELVNGFEECPDREENERRMLGENQKRRALGKPELPLDLDFIAALESGLPACSGAALGLDRLIMLALDKKCIDEVLAFPWMRC